MNFAQCKGEKETDSKRSSERNLHNKKGVIADFLSFRHKLFGHYSLVRVFILSALWGFNSVPLVRKSITFV
jgi:hypothetical protein